LTSTRTLRSTAANPASDSSSAPGCLQSSATTQTATPTPKPARTTPVCHPSPKPPGPNGSSYRYARNRRLGDALFLQAFAALNNSPGARAFYDQQRARGATHYQALRTLANRLVGILHGCLRTHTLYEEHLAWHHEPDKLSSAA
jgi:cell division septation protein DedD